VNSAEFAESQGFSRPYVTKLVQQGVIERDANGQIDKDAAVAALAARRDPAKALRRGRPAHKGEITAANGQMSEALSTLMLKSRIKTEVERGKLAELIASSAKASSSSVVRSRKPPLQVHAGYATL
jgi:hypothetical protein